MSVVRSRQSLSKGGRLIWVLLLLFSWARFASISNFRTFHYDEWAFVLLRWHVNVDTLLLPHNGHMSVVPIAIWMVLFRVVGLDNYGLYQAIGYLSHFLVASLLLVLLVRRLGITAGLAIASSFLLLGTGAENILWPFQIGLMLSVAGYLMSLHAIDLRGTRAPWLILTSLLVALGSSGFGVIAVVGTTFEVIARRCDRRYWYAVGVPAVLWAVWYAIYGQSQMRRENAPLVPKYVHEAFAGSLSALVNESRAWGFVAAWTLLIVVLVHFASKRHSRVRLAGVSVSLLLFWTVTALSRAQYWSPSGGRYVYIACALLLLALAELISTLDENRILASCIVFAVWSISSTWNVMNDYGEWLREWGESVGMELRALESRLDTSPDDYRPDPVRAPNIYAGDYRRAVEGLGSSPAFDDVGAANASASARAEMDRVLFELNAVDVDVVDFQMDCRSRTWVEDELMLQNGEQFVMLSDGTAEVGFRSFGSDIVPLSRLQLKADNALRVIVDSRLLGENWYLEVITPGVRVCARQ